MMEGEPGVRWLAALEEEGLLNWSVLMQDGTKMEAKASKWSYRREGHIAERVRVAREAMSALEQQAADSVIQIEKRVRAAQIRSAEERVERMEAALASLRE